MKSHLLTTISLVALMIAAGNANAQFRQSIFLNGNIPTGGFAKSITDQIVDLPWTMTHMGKEASIGFGAGYRASYRFDVGIGEVAPYAQADLFWNTIDGKWRDVYAGRQYKAPHYFNLPVLAGVSYLYDELWNDITIFGEFGLGADFLFITPEGTGKGIEHYAYKPTGTFAWMLGAGAYFGRHVSAGLYYYGLGKHYIDYTSKTLENNSTAAAQNELYKLNKQRESRTVGSLVLRIGFHF